MNERTAVPDWWLSLMLHGPGGLLQMSDSP